MQRAILDPVWLPNVRLPHQSATRRLARTGLILDPVWLHQPKFSAFAKTTQNPLYQLITTTDPILRISF